MVTSTTQTAKTAKKRVTEQNAPTAIFTFNKCLISIRSIRNAPGFKPTHEDFYLYFGTGSSGQKVLSLKKTKQNKEEELKSNYYWG